MPNWCYTNGRVHGDAETIQGIYEAFQKATSKEFVDAFYEKYFPDMADTLSESEMQYGCLSNLVYYTYGTPDVYEKIPCRGELGWWHVEEDGNVLCFEFTSAWRCHLDALVGLIETVTGQISKTDIDIKYCAEESGNRYFFYE